VTSTVSLPLPRDVQRRLAAAGGLQLDMVVSAQTSAGQETKGSQLDVVAPRAVAVASVTPDPVATRGRTAVVDVRCAGTIPMHCGGPVQLVALPQGRRAARASDPVVGTTRVAGAAGATLPAKVALNATGRALLAKRGTLRVVARMTVPETGATRSSAPFAFRSMTEAEWLRRVIAEMQSAAPARMRLNNLLDRMNAGELTPDQTADLIESDTLKAREATLRRIAVYRQAPAGLERASRLLLRSYQQSVIANEQIIIWLRNGADHVNDTAWRYSAAASATKALLIAELVEAARPLGIPVPPATSLYP